MQAGHSNVRISKPGGPGAIRASIVAIWHVGHGGRGWGNTVARPYQTARALQNSQSPVVAESGAVMEPAWNFRDSAAVPFCTHFKIIDASPADDAPRIQIGTMA